MEKGIATIGRALAWSRPEEKNVSYEVYSHKEVGYCHTP
jgi:hypothetical protein